MSRFRPRFRRVAAFGFLNERAFLEMVAAVYDRVRAALADGHFPLLYGAD